MRYPPIAPNPRRRKLVARIPRAPLAFDSGRPLDMGSQTEFLVYSILGGVFTIAMVSIIGGFLHCRRERLLSHRERIKALELGRDFPDDPATAQVKAALGNGPAEGKEAPGSLSRKCFSTALWVAFWGFIAANSGGGHEPVAVAIATAVGFIGVASVICGTLLALRAPATIVQHSSPKPEFDDTDAYDVVSRRG
jgi:hypothetical protein